MIESLEQLDRSLFEFLNSLHNPVLDHIMLFMSNKYVWIPLYLLLLYGFVKYSDQKVVEVVLMIAICIFISDQVASGFLKPTVQRLRPCYDELLSNVHLVGGCGGKYGFASSHSSNSFGVATLAFLLLKGRFKFIKYIFVWAALVAYSRIYLGVHFPGDTIVGALIGFLAANIALKGVNFVSSKLDKGNG